jgi:dTDP-4-amino-4,6-dideoxygalactose transaminase
MKPRYYHQIVGINSRLDAMQAAILRVKLRYLDAWTQQRQHNAAQYEVMFVAAGLDQHLVLPVANPSNEHVWNQFTIRVPDGGRDALRAHLTASRIGSEIYYPIPLHQQECFAELRSQAVTLPVTNTAAQEVLSLPVFPGLTETEQLYVVNHIADHFGVHRV